MDRPRPRLRSPLMRKKKTTPISEKVQLERVLGLTSTSNASLACDQHTGTIAYPAGCVVVLYNAKRNRQSHILNASKKTITCIAFTADGKYLATGESGHQPAVRVWEVETKTQFAEFKGHKFGISCVAFSPNMKQVISIGTQHDMAINVWNWRSKAKISSNKVAAKVTQVAFAEDSSSFVTVGNRHVKFWYLGATKARVNETVPLQGRSGILGDQKNNFFCGVGCGRGELANNTYCITESGLLCQFNEKRLLDKWVELRTTSAHCLSIGEKHIYIGCADGVIRVFSAKTLHFLATLPRPHYLGVDVAAGMEPSHMIPKKNNARYPDTLGLVLDDNNKKVTAIYNDHSMYIWDVSDIHHVGKSRSFLYHSSCIWGIEMYESHEDELKNTLPPLSFITCSSDDTIRMWNLDPHMNNSGNLKRNIYSQDLLKTVYTDKEFSNLLNKSFNPAGNKDKTDTQCLEKNGIRCVKVSPDGQHLASGDRVGNIRIHDLATMTELCMLEAHESEVLCLQYTNPDTGVKLLTSASRDRLIHVFDTEQEYGIVQTLDDHSSAITSIQFSEMDGQLHMLSCGADKSILFRTAQQEPEFEFVLNRHLVGKTTLYDMDVDATKKYVATACQDRNVRIYNIKNGKQKKCYKGSVGDDGTIIKVQLDPSGGYAATSCSDKNLCLFDFFTGECVASMFGHSELVTGIKFMPDLRHLVSVSGDGCIFVWKLPYEFTEHMQARLVDLGKLSQEEIINTEIRHGTFMSSQNLIHSKSDTDFAPASKVLNDENKGFENSANGNKSDGLHKPGYRFSVGQLPTWAKKQVLNEPQSKPAAPELPNVAGPKGRWAQRVETQGIVMKSLLDDNAAIQLSLSDCMDKRRFTVEPDSLQDQLKGLNLRRETIVIPKPENKLQNIPIITDDENNRDDDEDDEFCSNRDQLEQMLDDAQTMREPEMMDGKITLNRGPGDKYRSSAPFTMTPPGRRIGLSHTPGRFSDSSLLMKADSLDEEEEEPEEGEPDSKEVIFYFPNDGSEMSDTSSFQVMEGDTASYRDAEQPCKESEGTDPHSLDSDEDVPTPTTPTKEFSSGSDKEEGFLRSHFENLASGKEGFSSNPDVLIQPLDPSDPGNFFNSRLSISSRFLSRSQQQHLRALAIQSGALAPSPRSVSPSMDSNNVSWKSDTIPEKEISWSSNSPPSKDLPDPTKHDKGHRNSYGSLDRRSRKDEKATKMDVRLESPNRHFDSHTLPKSKSERNLSTESTDSDSSAKRRSIQRQHSQHSYQMATRSSSAKMSKSSSISAINKSVLDDGTQSKSPVSPKKSGAVSRRRTGALDPGMKNKFKSTPDLASQLDEDDDDFNYNPKKKKVPTATLR